MTIAERLSRVAMIPLAPVLFVQGKWLRRTTPRLPEAALPWQGTHPGPDPLRLLVLGDSTAAGVGAATQTEALPGHLATAITNHRKRGVEWTAIGRSSATARDIIDEHLELAEQGRYDLIFVSIGANDALGVRSRRAFGRDLHHILTRLRATNPDAFLLVSSLPAFFRFVLLPQPLRSSLYRHSRSLEAEGRAVVAGFDNAHMSPPPPPYTEGFFASDLFHPSAQGYRDWAHFAIADARESGALS